MWNDPIVEEVRQARSEYAARFQYDIVAIFKDLRKQQEEASEQGWEIVSLAPKKQTPGAPSATES